MYRRDATCLFLAAFSAEVIVYAESAGSCDCTAEELQSQLLHKSGKFSL